MATKRKTTNKPTGKPARKPAKGSAKKPTRKPAKQATKRPGKTPAKKPQKPARKAAKKVQKPARKPAVQPARKAAKQPTRAGAKKPKKTLPRKQLETQVETMTVTQVNAAGENGVTETFVIAVTEGPANQDSTLETEEPETEEPETESGLAGVTSITAYKDALFMKAYLVNNGASVSSEEWNAFLRAFRWFSHEPIFQDLHDAAMSAMPILGGYLMHLIANRAPEHDVARLNKAMDVLATYLDEAAVELAQDEEATAVVATALYDLPETLEALPTSVLDIAPVVRANNDELAAREGSSVGLRDLLARSDADRVRAVAERFQDVSTVKNCVYNMVRTAGEQLLGDIEATIYDLHPADQNYILHGLDAFPQSAAVLEFYRRFLDKNPYEFLAKEVAKYAERVRSGKQTSGWET